MSNTTNTESRTDSLMSAKEVAALLSVSTSLIYQYKDDGTLNAVPIPKSTKIAFARSEVDQFLADLIEKRRIAPVVHRTDRNNKTPVSMTREDKQKLERDRRGLPSDYVFASEEETI